MLLKITKSAFSYSIKSPLDLKLFKDKDSLNIVKQSLVKRFRDVNIAQKIQLSLEDHRKKLYNLEQYNKKVNLFQKQIKSIIKDNQKREQRALELKELQNQLSQIKIKQKQYQQQIKNDIKDIQENILKVGNIVHKNTPVSKDEKQNSILKEFVPKEGLKQKCPGYPQLCKTAGITDLSRGQKVSGHRGYFLKTNGVKLAQALTHYAIDFLQQRGYQLYHSPALISESVLRASCQLQTIQQDVYRLQNSNLCLIATSEQTLAGYYQEEVLENRNLPIKMGGYSTCFRKEAGAHGKDIHGLFRVHQFQKVQQFVISNQSTSDQEMENMIKVSQQFYQSLNIPFRVVDIVSGELNDAASRKYDLQAWYPSQQKYRELVSVSNCLDYQSRLLKIYYRNSENQLKFPHMLNGTLIAIQRTITCILQNYFRQNYIEIPKQLQKYYNKDKIVLKKQN